MALHWMVTEIQTGCVPRHCPAHPHSPCFTAGEHWLLTAHYSVAFKTFSTCTALKYCMVCVNYSVVIFYTASQDLFGFFCFWHGVVVSPQGVIYFCVWSNQGGIYIWGCDKYRSWGIYFWVLRGCTYICVWGKLQFTGCVAFDFSTNIS